MEGTFNSKEQFEQVLYKTVEKAGETSLGKFMSLVSSEDKDKIRELYGVEKIGTKIVELLEAAPEKYIFISKTDSNKNNWIFTLAGSDSNRKEISVEKNNSKKEKNLPPWIEKKQQKQAKLFAEIANAQPSDKFSTKETFNNYIESIINEMESFSITTIIEKYFTLSERKTFMDIFGSNIKIGAEIKKIIDACKKFEIKTKASPDFNTWVYQKKKATERNNEWQHNNSSTSMEDNEKIIISDKSTAPSDINNTKGADKVLTNTIKISEETDDLPSSSDLSNNGTVIQVDQSLKKMVLKDMVLINDTFYISKFLVTQELYESVMGENPSSFKDNPDPKEKQERRPVETVSYLEAIEFCNQLSEKCGFASCYKNGIYTSEINGFRLPTENEWNFVATAENKNSFIYAGSNVPDGFAWYKHNSKTKTHEVGKKNPVIINDDGIYDMNGNVWEWVMSDSNADKALFIGGSYEDSEDYLELGKTMNKELTDKNTKNSKIGFRICVNSLK